MINDVRLKRLPKSSSLFLSDTFDGRGVGGGGGEVKETEGLFNLAKMVVLVLHKDLECKVEKLKYKKLEVMQPRVDQEQIRPFHE